MRRINLLDKRLAKRHKRQVERAKEHVKLSEPDVRTPEQIAAAREASRPTGSGGRAGVSAQFNAQSVRSRGGPTGHSAAKTDV
jgi:hypothetical protein